VSETVAELVDGFFELEPIGAHPIRGIDRPVPLFRPVRPSGQKTRFDLARRRGLTALIGRRAELDLLIQRVEGARRGRGRAVLISAEAGLGKSRLVEELRARTADERRTWITIGGSPYHQDSPFHPMVDLTRQILGIGADLPAGEQLRMLERGVAELESPAESVAVLASLLGLTPEAGAAPITDPPQRLKERIRQSLVGLVIQAAARGLVIVAVEDLHWIDASTLDVLDTAVTRASNLPLLLVMTARPSFSLGWEGRSRLLQITLDPLEDSEVVALIGQLAGARGVPRSVVEQLVHRADGVPLYVEELTRTVLAAGDRAEPAAAAIPATLEDSLRARLDQLDGVDATLLAAAAIGREASFETLVAVTDLEQSVLRSQLDQLVEADILATHGVGSSPGYGFRHALIREAAYGSLLSSSRAALHRKIARLTIEQFPEQSAAHPEITAHHLHQAGQPLEAMPWWIRAGQRSAARFAIVEALSH
jgi:predicted ATPase